MPELEGGLDGGRPATTVLALDFGLAPALVGLATPADVVVVPGNRIALSNNPPLTDLTDGLRIFVPAAIPASVLIRDGGATLFCFGVRSTSTSTPSSMPPSTSASKYGSSDPLSLSTSTGLVACG